MVTQTLVPDPATLATTVAMSPNSSQVSQRRACFILVSMVTKTPRSAVLSKRLHMFLKLQRKKISLEEDLVIS